MSENKFFKREGFFFSLFVFGMVFCNNSDASSNWYVVKNYIGTIGKYPVHLSIQSYDFGKEVSIEGSYYYDRHRAPIALYGKDVSGVIELCEATTKENFEKYIASGDKFDLSKCPLKVIKNGQELNGEWHDGKNKLEVSLRNVSSMDKTSIVSENGIVEIPFWGQTDKHSFIGIYEKDGADISIAKIKVLDKTNGNVIQVITPQKQECEFGFYMTPIYQNVEGFNNNSIYLNCYSTRADVIVNYKFDDNKYVEQKE
ncbi:hypothetical protein [Enterobacter sp. P82]|uniref:hypothetical protein n=1 Tax=Enterobacter sp. P82 TaxID=3123033 RepID=UPI00300CCD44